MVDLIVKKDSWLELAKESYDQATTYIDNNFRSQWDTNLKHFHSKHRSGSKYYKSSYKYRSKIFRPKTRSAVRNNEAAANAAFFTTDDPAFVEPVNPSDPIQVISAEINKHLLHYRLNHSIKWFQTLMGAIQDAQVVGAVASYNYWDHKTDSPAIDLIPIENLRISPAASWIDPIGSSPYLIHLVPMYIEDVMERMEVEDEKLGPAWKKLTRDQLAAATKQEDDLTRLSRLRGREDNLLSDTEKHTKTFDIVWIHRNFIRIGGVEVVYHTAGTEFLLSDPVRLEEVYFHGERPITLGCSIIETHRPIPSSLVELGETLQNETNEIVNNRLDNVKLVLNKRYFVRRGGNVSLKTLLRNAAGSVTLMGDVDKDVKAVDFTDVTSSSYQEQDRLNVDYDELLGAFSTGSIQSNRKLNETVGGMAMLKQGSSTMQEYLLKTISETWIEPTLQQIIKLEQAYETDMTILSIAADKAQLYQKYGIDTMTNQLLNQELTCTVNAGIGASDPLVKLERFLFGLKSYGEFIKEAPPDANVEQIRKEIFGRLGYKNGGNFFYSSEEDQQQMAQFQQIIQQLQQELIQVQQELESKASENQVKLLVERMKQGGESDRQEDQIIADIFIERMKQAGQKKKVSAKNG